MPCAEASDADSRAVERRPSGNRGVLLLNRGEVRSLLTWPELIEAARSALVDVATAGKARTVASQLVVPGASLHLKAGALTDPPVMSVKANLRPDGGSSSGGILAYDLAQQRLHAIMASSDLTSMRTAAIAAVAARAFVPSGSVPVAILGAGPVAQRVHEAFAHLGLASEVSVWSRHPEHSQMFAAAAGGPVECRSVVDVEDAVKGASLVVTCTPATAPLFEATDLGPEASVIAMGADSPGKRELPSGLMESATVYVDVREDALAVGDSAYLSEEAATHVREIGSYLTDGLPSRRPGSQAVFDSVGSSAVDAATVALVLDRAAQKGRGRWIDLEGTDL